MENPLKIGNVKFSQEDTAITVGGVPLSVVRTYDSFQKDKSGDFGYGWSYSIANMNIQLEEDRMDMAVFDADWGTTTHQTESIRVSPNYDRNVTLTLPDGNRATFQFYLEYQPPRPFKGEIMPCYIARYQSPEGVTVTLETLDEEILSAMNVWEGQDTATHFSGSSEGVYSDPDYYEFSGYRLTTEDGTQYIFQRRELTTYGELFGDEAVYVEPKGQPYLASIVTPSGETINMNVDEYSLRVGQANNAGIEHQIGQEVTKAIKIEYGTGKDVQRIVAIYAPMEQGGTVPTVKYGYDSAGNLQYVRKLADKALAASSAAASDPNLGYEVLTYVYEGPQYDKDGHLTHIYKKSDHYITKINDPRGLTPIQYEYDPQGRLIATIDAKGNRIELAHNISDRKETVYDRTDTAKVNPTVYFYSPRGNVTQTIKYNNNVAVETVDYAYNDTNNPDKQTSVTNHVPDPSNPSVNIPSVTTYAYTNHYDPDTNVLIKDKIASQTVTDPVSNLTKTIYDRNGNVTSTIQGKNATSETVYTEVLTSRTCYTLDNEIGGIHANLPYITGTRTGVENSYAWHSLSLTFYNSANRVLQTVQIDMDSSTAVNQIFTTSKEKGDVKSYSQLAAITNWPGCSVTSYVYDSSLSNSPDQPYSVTDASGQAQYFYYDKNNRQTSSWYTWEDPADNDTVIDFYVYSANIYDDAGRVVRTEQIIDDATLGAPYVSERTLSQMIYNSIGKVDYTLDENGLLTKSLYDQTGNVAETLVYSSLAAYNNNFASYLGSGSNTGILTISRTLYDKEGRAVVSVGPYDPADLANHKPVGTETVYDNLGRVERTRRWADVAITLENVIGTGGAVVGREATGWTRGHDANGNALVPVIGQELSYNRTIYDSAGRVSHSIVTDENRYERVTSYLYDIANRQIAVIDHLGHDITYTPQTIGGVVWNIATSISLKADESHRTDTYYDGSRRDYVEDAAGNITRFMYDAAGRMIRTMYPDSAIDGVTGSVPTYSHVKYDGLGRKTWESAQTCQIDPEHTDLTTETNNDKLRRKYFGYDAGGKPTSVTMSVVQNPESSNAWTAPVYRYVYDDYGNQIGILDPKNHLTVFKFDCLNRQKMKYQPFVYTGALTPSAIYTAAANQAGLKYEATTYDNLGRVDTQTDCKGQLTRYWYDSFGRVEYERHYINQLAYDSALKAKNADPQIYTEYDNLGRKRRITQQAYNSSGNPVGTAQQWEYKYDNEGRIVKITSLQGVIDYTYSQVTSRTTLVCKDLTDLVTRYGYDELGRLSEVQVMMRNGIVPNPAEITHYGYDAVGNLDWTQLPNGNYTDYAYNALNRLTEQVNYQTKPTTQNPNPTVLSSYAYKVYADGQRSESTETFYGSDPIAYGWKYDNLNRLLEEKLFDPGTLTNYWSYQRVYDLVGNVKTYTTDQSGTSVTTNYTYNAKDQLLTEMAGGSTITYGYDDNGSLISKQTTGGTETYVYDLCGKLKTFTPATGLPTTYKYDPDGNRVSKSTAGVDTEYVVDSMNPTGYSQVLAETTGIYQTYYTIGLDMIGQWNTTDGLRYYVYDGHGSVRQLTQPNSTLVQSQEFWYDAYGNELGGNTPQTNLLYCGEQRDTESGLYYLRARMYNPQNGRFTSVDPFEGNNADPISFHKYLYCHGNPVNYADPSGQTIWDFLQSMEPAQALRILIGIRVTYRLGDAYIDEEERYKSKVNVNLQIARLTDLDIINGEVKWEGLFKKRPDICDLDRGDVYEIRPDNPEAIAQGYKDVQEYLKTLHQRYSGKTFFPGLWQPRAPVYWVAGIPGVPWIEPLKISARNAGGGVIAYRIDDKDLKERVHELTEVMQILFAEGLAASTIQVNQAVTAAQVESIAEVAVEKAIMVPTTEILELEDETTIATIDSIAGVP